MKRFSLVRPRLCRVVVGVAAVLVVPGLAAAAEAPPAAPPTPTGTAGGQAPATAGATEIEGQGKFATAEVAPEQGEDKKPESLDATEVSVSAGGILSTGNARSAAATGGANFRLRRYVHQVSAAAAGNYGAAGVEGNDEYEQTLGNVQGRARYDIFFAKRWSGFTMVTARNDRFQGLDLRLNVDPGVAFYAVNKLTHRLWFEAGYDFQYDVRTDDAILDRDDAGAIILDADGEPNEIADKTAVNHAARLFAGYDNRLDERVVFTTGLEYLQSLTDGATFRLAWDTSLSTQLFNRFSLAATFTLRYENNPLPSIEELDTVTALNLMYRFP